LKVYISKISIIILVFFSSSIYGQINTDSILVLHKDSLHSRSSDRLIIDETNESSSIDQGSNENMLEIDGLIVDETKTKGGRDFYEYFYNNWEEPLGASNYTIIIKELPFRLSTTQIQVLVNDEYLVYQSPLQQRYDIVIEMSKIALRRLKGFLSNYDRIVKELGGSDQQGNGIY
jgi:curli production assembly/transport component CsgE